ncbi:MAG: hypothetical protein HQ507_04230 [Candidatus Marinimicrobia bacterium]|nr:hypothetical protein [Candidatus Neomarinimicrobiota bacterium]
MTRQKKLRDLITFQESTAKFEPLNLSTILFKPDTQKKLVSQVSISEIVDHGPGKSSQMTLQLNQASGSHLLL